MIVFVVYAVVAWYFAARHRRSWRGVLVVCLTAAGLGLVAYGHWRLNVWTHGRIYFRVLQGLLYPYAALVLLMAGFIVSLPRPGRRMAPACARCRYDLTGLVAGSHCPECGHRGAISPGANATPSRAAAPAREAPRSLPIGAPAGVLRSPGQ